MHEMQWTKLDGEPVLIGKGELTMERDFPTGRLKGKTHQRAKLKAKRFAAQRETERLRTINYSQGKQIHKKGDLKK